MKKLSLIIVSIGVFSFGVIVGNNADLIEIKSLLPDLSTFAQEPVDHFPSTLASDTEVDDQGALPQFPVDFEAISASQADEPVMVDPFFTDDEVAELRDAADRVKGFVPRVFQQAEEVGEGVRYLFSEDYERMFDEYPIDREGKVSRLTHGVDTREQWEAVQEAARNGEFKTMADLSRWKQERGIPGVVWPPEDREAWQ